MDSLEAPGLARPSTPEGADPVSSHPTPIPCQPADEIPGRVLRQADTLIRNPLIGSAPGSNAFVRDVHVDIDYVAKRNSPKLHGARSLRAIGEGR